MAREDKLIRKIEKRAVNLQKRGYEGAKTGRRTSGWVSAGTSANAEIAPAMSLLRNRSRELVRNNPYAAKAMRVLSTHRVKTGIIANIPNKNIAKLWLKWITECDADGYFDFYGLQSLISRAEPESGEVLIRFRYRKESDGLSVPLQLQVLEADYIDSLKNETLKNGGWIQYGIEYNAIGQRVAYWLYPQHPGEAAPILSSLQSSRVDADDIIHFFVKTRPGQSRGVPIMSAAMLTANDLDDYLEATLVRKGVEACIAGFVETDDEVRSIGSETTDSAGNRIEEISPGMVQYLSGGEKITFNNPPSSSGDVGYTNDRLHAIAVGAGVTYEKMTGDLSQVNFSSIRAGEIDFRNEIEQWQWLHFIPVVCRRVMDKFLNIAVLAGKIRTSDIIVDWTTPRFDWVDPTKDTQAEGMELGLSLKTWSDSVRGRGYDPEALFAAMVEERKKFADAGIPYPADNLKIKGVGNQNTEGQQPEK